MQAFDRPPEGFRKVVIATNIAETSITINGIRFVVDCGLVKARVYNPRIGLDSLMIIPISKAGARQRAGRAGRDAPGCCYRVYTEPTFKQLEDNSVPEILRCPLDNVLLQMKAMGIDDILSFPFLNPPPRETIRHAFETLLSLGALSSNQQLTELGKRMAELPLEPMLSKAVIVSQEFDCFEEILSIVSMLSVENIFYNPHDKMQEVSTARNRFSAKEGDHLTLLAVYESFQEAKDKKLFCDENFINFKAMKKVLEIRKQLVEYTDRMKSTQTLLSDDRSHVSGDRLENVLRCLASAFFRNLAILQEDGRYKTLRDGKETFIHPSSSLFGKKKPKTIIFTELVLTTKQYMRDISEVQTSWLTTLAPQYFRNTN